MQPKRFNKKYFQKKFVGSNNQRYGTFISPTFVLNLISRSKNDLKGLVLGLAGFGWPALCVSVAVSHIPNSSHTLKLNTSVWSLEKSQKRWTM